MKTLKKLSKNASEFCELSGFDPDKVKEAMKSSAFSIQRCETKMDMYNEGVDYAYPYKIFNPLTFDIR